MQSSNKIFLTDNNHRSSLEDLPNELFYDMFIYLLPEDLFKAFGNLNSHFATLIRSVFLHFRITKDNVGMLSVISANQIKSMMMDDLINLHVLVNYFRRNQFTHLQRVDFTFMWFESLQFFLEIIPKLDNLKCLRIHGQNIQNNEQAEVVYQTIAELPFTLPFLKRFKHIEIYIPGMTPYYGYIPTPNPLSILEYFSVFSICLDDLTIILSWMPRIKYIKIIYIFIVNDDDDDNNNFQLHENDLTSRAIIKMPIVNSLHRLNIGVCDGVTIGHMELFLNKLPELRWFECAFWSGNALIPEKWIPLILRSKIDSLKFIAIRESKYGHLAHQFKADIWYRQIFKTAIVEETNSGFSFEAHGVNESRATAVKELDEKLLNEQQTKKQRIN